jgi:PhoPQ-activated pathogenicity-related protein
MKYRLTILSALLFTLSSAAYADLKDYVHKGDKVYTWYKQSEVKNSLGAIYDLHLVSQKWQGITWEHRLQVFTPKKNEFPGACVLLVTGGGGSDSEKVLGQTVANSTGVPVAVLYHIPNQPLFGGKSEDELIAYTFDQYLETGDESWPLLFPMVKSAVRAMDALQAWAVSESMPPLKRFIVTGASKRGWTTWLTAATGDSRVKGIMPMVYDNLNLPAQMPHQLQTWGKYSEQIEDYTKRGLQQKMGILRGKTLGTMVDPYTFRKTLSLPKLIVNGTNDRYWAGDALNLYWEDLPGQKSILYGVNSGHGLENSLPAILSAATAFIRSVAADKPLPAMHWRYDPTDAGLKLTILAKPNAKSARLWTATSDSKDFRNAKWTSVSMEEGPEGFTASIVRPSSGYLSVFGEATLESGVHSYPSSTQVQILGSK